MAWERLLYAMSKSEPVVRKVPGRCPRCQHVNVLFTRDDGYTECRWRDGRGQACGRRLSEQEYEELVEGADSAVVSESQRERQAS